MHGTAAAPTEPGHRAAARERGLASVLLAEGVAKSYSGIPALIDGRMELKAGSVHALCGGNGAGKSTFLNIVMGLQRRDAGDIRIMGRPVHYATPSQALADGIAFIAQELSPVLDMTVAENMALGREPRIGGVFVDRRRMKDAAAAVFDRLGFDIDPAATMRDLSLAKRQLVEISKAISRNADVIIMDEPTSAIGERETEALFEVVRSLQARNVGIVYVSHRLGEIFSIADSYTVFRDGRTVESGRIADIGREHLVRLIVGRTLDDHRRSTARKSQAVLFEARGFSRRGAFEDIRVTIRRGEIFGIYGLTGSGRSEFVNAVYGNEHKDSGEVLVDGRPVAIDRPADALASGIALVTEDRKETGLVLPVSVGHNVSLPALGKVSLGPFVHPPKERGLVDRMVERLRVKAASRDLPVEQLSGGNQQKVVFARCLVTQPRILICDEPTRGIDEGAKREIYALLDRYAAEGNAVLMVSSEIPELLANCDRIAVFRRGRIAAELDAADASQDALMHLAS